MNGKAVPGPNQHCGTSVIWLLWDVKKSCAFAVAMFNCMMSVKCKHVQ